MKYWLLISFSILFSNAWAADVSSSSSPPAPVNVGVLFGGQSYSINSSKIQQSETYLTPAVVASVLIVDNGFLSEVSNPVYAEVLFGKAITPDGTGYTYAADLRWDLKLGRHWIPFGKVGLGGTSFSPASSLSVVDISVLGGIGIFYRPFEAPVALRLDIATVGGGVGVSFEF